MPRYDYACDKCGITDEFALPTVPCVMPQVPTCTCGKDMRRVFSKVNFSVKGYNSANDFNKDSDGWKEKVSI